jgi:MFS family permease
MVDTLQQIETSVEKTERSTKNLSRIALFLGEVRDGLTMINMQSAFLITSKGYSEKQAGILFFVFGMSQFLAQTPAGYLMDYSDKKVLLLGTAAVGTTLLTAATAFFAQENGANLAFMVFLKFLQGAITALIPPGLNSITQGIVGSTGMTGQVSMNEKMNHLGTAIIVLIGSLLAFGMYPNIGLLFVVSPIACAGVMFYLKRIQPGDIDHNAARGLDMPKVGNSAQVYSPPPTKESIGETPSFSFGFGASDETTEDRSKANSPLQVFRDPTLLIFILICFTFHLSNGTVLPLVMQTLAIANGRAGILMSGFCIIIAQIFMVASAHVCGKYSGMYGRKGLFLLGMLSVPVRCAILTLLVHIKQVNGESAFLDILMLSTQILDGVGAGIFGTMYVLVTSDISGGTGRFSLTLGLTTAAMSIGGTVSGYLGQALAEDIGYRQAFMILGCMSLLPASLYFFCMPETLSAEESQKAKNTASGMGGIAEDDEGDATTPFGRFA